MSWDTIMVALLSLIGTIAGAYFSNKKQGALVAYRLEELEKRVAKHNSLVERTYKLEGRMLEVEHDIKDLKGR